MRRSIQWKCYHAEEQRISENEMVIHSGVCFCFRRFLCQPWWGLIDGRTTGSFFSPPSFYFYFFPQLQHSVTHLKKTHWVCVCNVSCTVCSFLDLHHEQCRIWIFTQCGYHHRNMLQVCLSAELSNYATQVMCKYSAWNFFWLQRQRKPSKLDVEKLLWGTFSAPYEWYLVGLG